MNYLKPKFFKSCLLIILSIVVLPLQTFAADVTMADTMRSNGKIYVVVAVVVCILLGLIFYIFQTERKLKKLEEEVRNLRDKE